MLRASKTIVKIACERDDVAFMAVEPVERLRFPRSIYSRVSTILDTTASVNPALRTIKKMQKLSVKFNSFARLFA